MKLLRDSESGYYIYVNPQDVRPGITPCQLRKLARKCYLVRCMRKNAAIIQGLHQKGLLKGVMYAKYVVPLKDEFPPAAMLLVDAKRMKHDVNILKQAIQSCSGDFQITPCDKLVADLCTCLVPVPVVKNAKPEDAILPSVRQPVAGPVLAAQLIGEDPYDSYAYMILTAILFGVVISTIVYIGYKTP